MKRFASLVFLSGAIAAFAQVPSFAGMFDILGSAIDKGSRAVQENSSKPSDSQSSGSQQSSPQAEQPEDSLPDAEMHNAEIEKGMIKAVMKREPEGTPVTSRILNDDWSVEHTYIGEIKNRSILGMVAFKRANGSCYYVTAMFTQSFNGQSFGPLYVSAGWGDNECGVKKELKPEALGGKSKK